MRVPFPDSSHTGPEDNYGPPPVPESDDDYEEVVARLEPRMGMEIDEAHRVFSKLHKDVAEKKRPYAAVGDIQPGEQLYVSGRLSADELEALSVIMRASRIEFGPR